MFKSIVNAKTDIGHLLAVALLAVVLTYFIMNILMVFVLWGFVGDGNYPASLDKWLNLAYSLSAIVLICPIFYYLMKVNYMRGRLSKAKTYLVAALIVLLCTTLLVCRLFLLHNGNIT
ncbi:MAG TPA: hypothetical protein VHE34_08810 [Puia sp.]|uniref:hypothetical protein n=1 Tax=Puia sp. TaxID=2045100 RepID=UPI002BAEC32E|nr:hypothetical protein [Puia sp.]HVU95311.1 hypothetical protein [Puia sp.]